MRAMIKTGLVATALAALAITLTGCVTSRLHLADDYGTAYRQNVIAQTDDPDAKYVGLPQEGAHGARVGLAQDRYVKGDVTQPASTSTSTVSVGGGSSPK
jgi:hypothetical protein